MERKKRNQLIVILALMVVITTVSVGFAATAYVRTLNYTGTANVTASKWDIHFNDASYTETAGSVAATSHTLTGSSMSYDVTLTKPGDYYEFTVSVVNAGTFDANLTGVTMSTLTAAQSKYLTYKLTYGSTEYTTTTTGITGVTLAKATGTETVKVRVEYVQPDSETDLPATNQNVSLTASLTYQQVQ